MEELRSTEILDKEIHADARNKVESILKSTEAECQKLINSVDERVEKSKQEREAFFDKKLKAAERDMVAALPLEKTRFDVSYVQSQIISGINEYLKVLPQKKHLELIVSELDKNASLIKEQKFNAYVYGLNLKDAEGALTKKLGKNLLKCQETEFGKYVSEDEIGLEHNEGIILETEDKALRLRLTLVQIFSNLLDSYRADLSAALFSK